MKKDKVSFAWNDTITEMYCKDKPEVDQEITVTPSSGCVFLDLGVCRADKLEAELTHYEAITQGQTFFHSDEAVNDELGRLRAENKKLKEALTERSYSVSEANQNERMVKPLAWTENPPTEAGIYINRLPGIIALVRVPKDLSMGIVITGNDFYHRSPLEQWSGEWYGPIPWGSV